jgi:hypothetical protein
LKVTITTREVGLIGYAFRRVSLFDGQQVPPSSETPPPGGAWWGQNSCRLRDKIGGLLPLFCRFLYNTCARHPRHKKGGRSVQHMCATFIFIFIFFCEITLVVFSDGAQLLTEAFTVKLGFQTCTQTQRLLGFKLGFQTRTQTLMRGHRSGSLRLWSAPAHPQHFSTKRSHYA